MDEVGLEGRDENDLGEQGDGGDRLDETLSSSRDGVGLGIATSQCPSSFLLLSPNPSPNMHFFSLLTSDSFTGFTMKSSAPSSKHLRYNR